MLYHFKPSRILKVFLIVHAHFGNTLVKKANKLFGYLIKAMEGNIESIILILFCIF